MADFNHAEYYGNVRNYLENLEYYLSEDEIDRLLYMAEKDITARQNVGIRPERCNHNPREKAFHDVWIKENMPLGYINQGHGILQNLFIETAPPSAIKCNKIIHRITPKERMIVATVIQWLGSNCGMGFLHEVLSKFGYVIIEKERM
jgi:hypothetical protein